MVTYVQIVYQNRRINYSAVDNILPVISLFNHGRPYMQQKKRAFNEKLANEHELYFLRSFFVF